MENNSQFSVPKKTIIRQKQKIYREESNKNLTYKDNALDIVVKKGKRYFTVKMQSAKKNDTDKTFKPQIHYCFEIAQVCRARGINKFKE